MKSLWNNFYFHFERPPTTAWEITHDQFDTKTFLKTINVIYYELQSQDQLHAEATLLSRLLYRMKRKFRHDKGLKNMEKVNRALLNYLQISLGGELKYLIDNTIVSHELDFLPTRQMMQYVLIRIQSFSKLMCRIEKVAIEAAEFLKVRIHLGQAWTVSAIAYAVISRIWILSRFLSKKCCIWYNKLYPFIKKLRLIGLKWLPINYQLPSDLRSWIMMSGVHTSVECISQNEHFSNVTFGLIKHGNVSDYETDLTTNMNTAIYQSETESTDYLKNENISMIINAIGEPVLRKTSNMKNSLKKKQKLKKHKIKLESEEDLRVLLTLDYYPGMDKLQWNILKNMTSRTLKFLVKCKTLEKREKLLKKLIKSIQKYIKDYIT